MGKSIIPIGKALGPYVENGEVKSYDLDLGPGYEELDIYQAAMWDLTHTNPDAQLERRFDRQILMDEFEKHNNTRFDDDKKRDIDKLIELKALVEVDLANDPLEPFLSEHIFMPMGRAYGNIGDDPELFGIGHDRPHLWVPQWTQTIWASSHRHGPVWNTCVKIADQIDGVSPEVVARNFVESIPALLAVYCGYLELK